AAACAPRKAALPARESARPARKTGSAIPPRSWRAAISAAPCCRAAARPRHTTPASETTGQQYPVPNSTPHPTKLACSPIALMRVGDERTSCLVRRIDDDDSKRLAENQQKCQNRNQY